MTVEQVPSGIALFGHVAHGILGGDQAHHVTTLPCAFRLRCGEIQAGHVLCSLPPAVQNVVARGTQNTLRDICWQLETTLYERGDLP